MSNQYAPDLSSVETNICGDIIAAKNVQYGGEMSRLTTTRVSSDVNSATKVASSSYGEFLNLFVQGATGLTGGLLEVYMGADDNAEKLLECPVAADSCVNPLSGGMAFPDGWSIYLTADGTNNIYCTYQTYMVAPTAQAEITIADDTNFDEANPDTNYVSNQDYEISNYSAGNEERPIIKFDLSSIPAGSNIIQAVLEFDMYAAGDLNAAQICAVTNSWTADEATWNSRKTGVAWDTAGGDYRATPEWSGEILYTSAQKFRPDITSLVQEWVDGSLDNNGVIMIAPNVSLGDEAKFWSMNAVTSSNRPRLFVQY